MSPLAGATATRRGEALLRFEELDARFRTWALAAGAEEERHGALIDAGALERAEYPKAFPHLLMTAAIAEDPAEPLSAPNLRLAGWYLSPAVCYHVYAGLAGQTLAGGQAITARGCCFRYEEAAALAPGRRQVEFEMRELVLLGEPAWIDAQLEMLRPGVDALAQQQGLRAAWQPASDPFFLPQAQGLAHMQKLLGTKLELCLPDGLAIASINRHGAFFGERFDIRTAEGASAHTACIAFGLDRWAAAATRDDETL